MRWTGPVCLLVLAIGASGCQVAAGARAHIMAPLPSEGVARPGGPVFTDPRGVPLPASGVSVGSVPGAGVPQRYSGPPAASARLPAASTAAILRRDPHADVATGLSASRVPTSASVGEGAWYGGVGGSFLPNVGLGVHLGRVVHVDANALWSLEAEGVFQFIDDESFADDGNPAAGDWVQAKLGVKVATQAGAQRRTTWRAGLAWVRAEGEPNILQFPGDYYGGYIGIGFESDIGSHLTVGPDLSLLVLTKNGSFTHGLVPQLGWRISVWPCGRPPSCATARLPGEIYAGGFATLSPAWGGGFQVGQRVRVDDAADWSFEVAGGVQSLADGRLFSEGDGDWAQVRGGLKATLGPRERLHWTMRAGAAWLRTTAPTEFLAEPADYFGLYAGVGLEADVMPQVRIGPELAAYVVTPEGGFEPEIVPQLLLHVLVRF